MLLIPVGGLVEAGKGIIACHPFGASLLNTGKEDVRRWDGCLVAEFRQLAGLYYWSGQPQVSPDQTYVPGSQYQNNQCGDLMMMGVSCDIMDAGWS